MDASFAIVFGIVAVVIGVSWWQHFLAQNRRRQQNFRWFAERHPQCVTQGRVSCSHCGGSRINARGLMRHTYMREHFCVTCGQTLYYSPEGGH
jgi:hypothetical protein